MRNPMLGESCGSMFLFGGVLNKIQEKVPAKVLIWAIPVHGMTDVWRLIESWAILKLTSASELAAVK